MPMDLHSHNYRGATSFNDGHTHNYSGTTSADPDEPRHTHEMAGYTTTDAGHTHYYAVTTGPGIEVQGGHYHYYEGVTQYASGHMHSFEGSTSVYQNQMSPTWEENRKLTREEYIRLSLELNLFFARIAKEHSIFLESGFTAKDVRLAEEAENFKIQFEVLLAEATSLANGVISPEVAASGELVTPFTLNAERVSQYFTGIKINSNITRAEGGLVGGPTSMLGPVLEQRVFVLNQKAIRLTTALAQFKSRILNSVLACKLFTVNYPLLLDHILREAKLYLRMLEKLQNREAILAAKDLPDQEIFWNRIMAEHSKFIRGLLDPTEVELINTANDFGNEFDELTMNAIAAQDQAMSFAGVTAESLKATQDLKEFKTAGTKGLMDCSIKAIAYPLLGDHVLREANHFIRILKIMEV